MKKHTALICLLLLPVLLAAGCASPSQIRSDDPTQSPPQNEVNEQSQPMRQEPAPTEQTEDPLPPPVTVLSWSEVEGGLDALAEYTELKSLDLRGCDADPSTLPQALAPLQKLEELDLRGIALATEDYDRIRELLPQCRIHWDVPLLGQRWDSTSEALTFPAAERESACEELLAVLPLFPDLKTADLQEMTLTDEEMAALFDALPGVELRFRFTLLGHELDYDTEELDLGRTAVRDLADFRAHLRYLPKLRYVNMYASPLSDTEMAGLREEYPRIKFVWTVHLGKWSLRTDAVAFSTKNASDSAVKLHDEDIAPLRFCTDLIALDLGHHQISSLEVIGELSTLKALILVDNLISDLSPLENLTRLEFLELYANPLITDVTPLLHMPALRELNISKCYGIADFTPFTEMPGVEKLYMNDTACDLETLALLRQAHPEADIECESKYSNGLGWRSSRRYKAAVAMFERKDYVHELFQD